MNLDTNMSNEACLTHLLKFLENSRAFEQETSRTEKKNTGPSFGGTRRQY